MGCVREEVGVAGEGCVGALGCYFACRFVGWGVSCLGLERSGVGGEGIPLPMPRSVRTTRTSLHSSVLLSKFFNSAWPFSEASESESESSLRCCPLRLFMSSSSEESGCSVTS